MSTGNLTQIKDDRKRHIGFRNTVFFKTSDFEYIIMSGMIITSVICLCLIIEEKFRPALLIGSVLTALMYIMMTCIRSYYRIWKPDCQIIETGVFEGNSHEAIFSLHRVGLKLKKKIGEYYIFSTCYRMLPNNEFIMREIQGYCYIQGNFSLMQKLTKYIKIDKLRRQGIDNYKNTTNYRG